MRGVYANAHHMVRGSGTETNSIDYVEMKQSGGS